MMRYRAGRLTVVAVSVLLAAASLLQIADAESVSRTSICPTSQQWSACKDGVQYLDKSCCEHTITNGKDEEFTRVVTDEYPIEVRKCGPPVLAIGVGIGALILGVVAGVGVGYMLFDKKQVAPGGGYPTIGGYPESTTEMTSSLSGTRMSRISGTSQGALPIRRSRSLSRSTQFSGQNYY